MKKLSLAELRGSFLIERGGMSRYAAGERSHPEGRHVHAGHEAFLILQGAGVIEVDGMATPIEAG
ncbi:MAG TPA: cupin domain-containing protein, partial [Micromonosporaceae bacterium]|nr:cupin domain-containing protein [Micromonosporaceae bacterium]